MPTKGELIRDKAVELIRANPDGLRFAELQRQLQRYFPDTPKNTIDGASWNIHVTRPDDIYKPTRGLFKCKSSTDGEAGETTEAPTEAVREEEFYEPFADWLKNDLGECSEAVAFGGNYMGKKWGTPDVIGIYKPAKRAVIQFQPEIISAEIKINPFDPVTAFGQAIAYRLFSSKVYLAEPTSIAAEDQDRIEALCILFGIGLILFDLDPKYPNFQIRVRAQRYNPDMFYVNQLADKLYNVNKSAFEKLF